MFDWSLGDQLCFVAYSESINLRMSILEFAQVVRKLSLQLSVRPSEFAYHTQYNLEDEGDQFPFDEDSLNQLQHSQTSEPILDLMIWSSQGSHDPAWDIYAEMVDAQHVYGCKYIYIQFPRDLIGELNEQSEFVLIKELFTSVSRLGRLDYGLVTTMDYSEMPWLYFRGFLIPHLSFERKVNLAVWQRQLGDYKERLRDLYWINVMGKKHLSRMRNNDVFIRNLERLLGSENLATTYDQSLLFRIPFKKGISEPFMTAIKKLLIENDLLMQPNDEDMKIGLDSSFRCLRPLNKQVETDQTADE